MSLAKTTVYNKSQNYKELSVFCFCKWQGSMYFIISLNEMADVLVLLNFIWTINRLLKYCIHLSNNSIWNLYKFWYNQAILIIIEFQVWCTVVYPIIVYFLEDKKVQAWQTTRWLLSLHSHKNNFKCGIPYGLSNRI